MAKTLYRGHGSYRFLPDDGTAVRVGPFAGEGHDEPADLEPGDVPELLFR